MSSGTIDRGSRRGLHTALLILASLLHPTSASAQPSATSGVSANGGSGVSTVTYVLVSGVLGGVTGYRRIEQRLVALGHRVIVVDPFQLAIDSTDVSFDALARLVNAELDARSVTTAKVVGHAHGGGVALRLAANDPRRISEVFLLNVGALAGNKSSVFSSSIKLAPLITRLPGGKSFVRRKIVEGIRENSGTSDWLDEPTRRAYTDPLVNNIGRVVRMARRLGESQEPEPLATMLGRVRVPVTLLLGALTCPASPGGAEIDALAPLGTRVRTHRIAATCHFPHEETPDTVVQFLTGPR